MATKPTTAAVPSKHELPSSEVSNYKKASRHYDSREYAKAIALTNSILAKAPLCSEAVALKGMSLYQADKLVGDDGALEVIKAGLKDNFKSGALWHALGSYHRGEKDDAEAYKCFKMAFRLDTQKTHAIQRDVCSMAIQMRDWATYSDARQQALNAKSNVRYNWVTYAVAQQMLGNHRLAAGIMDVMGQVMDWGEGAIETTEVHLYRAHLHLLCKQPKEAIQILTKEVKDVKDRTARLELLAKAYAMHNGKTAKEDAEKAHLELFQLQLNQRDIPYRLAELRGIAVEPLPLPKGLSPNGTKPKAPAESAAFTALLDELHAKFPRADAPKRLALDYCPLPEFQGRLTAYVAPLVAKMVPSLPSILKTLYASGASDRTAVVETVLLRWAEELQAGNGEVFAKAAPSYALFAGRPNPLWTVWVWQALSSHYLRLGDFPKAHEYIDKAIAHTPTIEMLHLHRAKVYARENNRVQAAYHADVARKLDLQDRYLNCKSAKYYLRNGDIEAAEHVISKFLKATLGADGPVDDTYLSMYDMQVAWYEVELGDAYMQRGDVYSAIMAYKMIEKQYRDNHDELVEYHAYVLRRCNVRAFLEVIENDDGANSQRFFLKTASRMIRAFLKVQEDGEQRVMERHVPRPADLADTPGLEPEDKKRLEKTMRESAVKVDLNDVLGQCKPYVVALQEHRGDSAETHELAFEVALRSCRPVQALRALKLLERVAGAEAVSPLAARLTQWRKVNETPASVAAALDAGLASLTKP